MTESSGLLPRDVTHCETWGADMGSRHGREFRPTPQGCDPLRDMGSRHGEQAWQRVQAYSPRMLPTAGHGEQTWGAGMAESSGLLPRDVTHCEAESSGQLPRDVTHCETWGAEMGSRHDRELRPTPQGCDPL